MKKRKFSFNLLWIGALNVEVSEFNEEFATMRSYESKEASAVRGVGIWPSGTVKASRIFAIYHDL